VTPGPRAVPPPARLPLPAQPLPAEPLPVAAIQAAAIPGDLPRNVATAARLTERAAARGAALVVFPELFLPGYHPPTLAADPVTCDVAADVHGRVADPRLRPLLAACAASGATVLIGASVRHADQRRTISLLSVAQGSVTVAYDKQHLWGTDEPALFTPGRRGAAISCRGWRLGLGICYDISFPEHARTAALAGAHAYVCPSVWLVGREQRRDLYFPTRALENTFYVIFSNAVQGAGAWQFSGGAAVYGPEGGVLARGPAGPERVVRANLDPAQLARVRAELPILAYYSEGRPRDPVLAAAAAPMTWPA
jgi:5-aminopentanamidase